MKATLPDLRQELFRLHKALIDAERRRYEQATNTKPTPHQWWHLLVGDPWFAWLHPLSQLIVAMDEALEAKEPMADETANELADRSRRLVQAGHEVFTQPYHAALQREPDIVVLHAEIIRLLRVQ